MRNALSPIEIRFEVFVIFKLVIPQLANASEPIDCTVSGMRRVPVMAVFSKAILPINEIDGVVGVVVESTSVGVVKDNVTILVFLKARSCIVVTLVGMDRPPPNGTFSKDATSIVDKLELA